MYHIVIRRDQSNSIGYEEPHIIAVLAELRREVVCGVVPRPSGSLRRWDEGIRAMSTHPASYSPHCFVCSSSGILAVGAARSATVTRIMAIDQIARRSIQ